ncbi:TetR family transcriptional regulator [Neisseria leonii]|uniref:TetR family transcriptional regulator n=1 Tax=Neisseria leonii TaxID=2995413 RepID=A0A9X4E2K6_9NEIS|nr:TetR family transcriptional regulator [Neisseria sp. 51.81]MDD9328476.1 TetR family transcriptional regulator [Neisseria sp. 51.81]
MRKAKAQATRQQLLDAALEAFYENGVAGTSLDAIAKRAGVTRGALYWHFKNKEDLFENLLKQTFDTVRHAFSDGLTQQADAAGTPLKNALTYLLAHAEENETTRKLCTILHLKCEHIEANRTITDIHKKYSALWEAHFRAAIEQEIRDGRLPADLDTDAATVFLQAAVNGLLQNWLYNQEWDLKRLTPPVLDTALFALSRSPALRRPPRQLAGDRQSGLR